MSACSAFGCTNRASKKIPGITFHMFPKDSKRREEWKRAVRRKDWTPSKRSLLCSAHFTPESFDRTSLRYVRLNETAVPSIFVFSTYKKKYQVRTCQELYAVIMNHKTQEDRRLCESFISVPNRSLAGYYDIVTSPIDLSTIGEKLKTGEYKDIQQFRSDVKLLVNNAKSYYEQSSQEYKDAIDLWKVFTAAKNHREEEKSREINNDAPKLPRRKLPRLLFNAVKRFVNSQGRKLSESFQDLPDRSCYPDYYQNIKKPISLSDIGKKIESHRYSILVQLVDDLNLVFENAKQYHKPGSRPFKDAVELQKVMLAKARKLIYSNPKKNTKIVTGYVLYLCEVTRLVMAANPNMSERDLNNIIKKQWQKLPKKFQKFYKDCSKKMDNKAQAQLLIEGIPRSPAEAIETSQVDTIKQEFILPDDGINLPFTNSSSELARVEMKFYVDQDEHATEPGSVPYDAHAAMDVTESIAMTPLVHDHTHLQCSSGQMSCSNMIRDSTITDTFWVDLNLVKKEPVDLDLVKEEVNNET